MALTFTRSAQDLIGVLGELVERTHPTLGPWCRPADAAAVRRAIIDRADDLRKLLDQAVRLIRLATLASARDYTQFLYLDVPALRPRLFKSAVEKARQSARLPPAAITVTAQGICLREATMALGDDPRLLAKGYELSYAQMARSAILLDVLHNTLGYRVVAEASQGIATRGAATISAKQVAGELRSRFNAWLAPRLESAHRRQQAKVLHAFLASREALAPDAISDEVVFAFWQSRAEAWHEQIAAARGQGSGTGPAVASVEKAARDEGFRVFRSTVRSVLRYRQALADAADAEALEQAPPLEDAVTPAESALGSEDNSSAPPWLSPLVLLARPPADQVKWLTEKEYRWLTNYVGRRPSHPTQDEDPEELGPDQLSEGAAGLMEGRYDLAFLRTLLRVDSLAPIQANLIAALKRSQARADALAVAVSSAAETTYADAVDTYIGLRDKIELEALAALNVLAEAGEPIALLLMEHLEPRARAALDQSAPDVLGPGVIPFARPRGAEERRVEEPGTLEDVELQGGPEMLRRLGFVMRRSFRGERASDGALAALISRSAAARKKISRAGFKPREAELPEIRGALAASVPSVIELMEQLDRLITRLTAEKFTIEGAADGRQFAHILKLIYSAPEVQGSPR